MRKYFKLIAVVSCFCVANGALAQVIEVDPAGELSVSAGQVSAPPPPPQMQSAPMDGDATYFYDSLKTHGVWMQVNPFGPVWRPNVAVQDSTWRPYNQGGKWIWQKNAWYWDSEYEWGWAPFHYGRWILSNKLGWVWIPGKEWSPAWVEWRKSSTQYGWAPLPPDKSVYIGISGTSDSGFIWGFQFGLTEDRYSYMPYNNCQETVYIYDSGYGYGYSSYYDNNYWPHHYNSRDYDHGRKPNYDHRNDRPEYDKPNRPEPLRNSEPSRRTTIMQQIVARTPSTVSAPSRPIQQSESVRASEPSRRTSIMQQVAASSSSRPIQQVVSQPRATSVPRSTSSNASSGNSSSDRRSSRIQDIISRTQHK